ncbi:hypothetical protein Rumeso_03858 [Rubellimicrobium mesophilum DSM 19309]|uniref:UPF0235 protein Rumeso_03858 n=1 Tax=Rubellimicrobium mesophilum DSM 19309 TaxID=442562 RepID=A0A017HJC2_9RHOB|nr:DUF167 family protein [Rubellimicrobium mesophilum]EYD74562.1 hypothetical protein Rumeso_03858 [Rubellimicrobium mesophilum DSM 19309]
MPPSPPPHRPAPPPPHHPEREPRTAIEGPETLADGTAVLRLRVRAVPENGKANAAVIVLVAKALGLPKSAVALVAGDTARLKTLHLDGDPEDLAARVERLWGR